MEFILELINTFVYLGCVINIGKLFLGYRQRHIKNRTLIVFIIAFFSSIIIPEGFV